MTRALSPGHLLWINTWPAWEVNGRPAPHPAIVIKAFSPERFLLLGITHSADLCRVAVRISAEATAWARPVGPLAPMPDVSFICVRDAAGDRAGLTFDWNGHASILTLPGKIPRAISARCVVHMGARWHEHFFPAISQALQR